MIEQNGIYKLKKIRNFFGTNTEDDFKVLKISGDTVYCKNLETDEICMINKNDLIDPDFPNDIYSDFEIIENKHEVKSMKIKQINEAIEKFLEGEVISFTDFKRKKELNKPERDLPDVDSFTQPSNEIQIHIDRIKVLWAEGPIAMPWFKPDEILPYDEFQDRVYEYDYIIKNSEQGYDKVKYEAAITVNGEPDTYTGRVDMGDGRDYVDIIKNMKHFIKEATDTDVTITNLPTPYNINKYKKSLEKRNSNNITEEPSNLATAKDYSEFKTKTGKDVEVGDILVCSWGYSMTLVDFYKVIERKKSSIKLAKLENKYVSGNSMQGQVVPTTNVKPDNNVDGKLFRVGVKWSSEIVCKINGNYAYYWDGKPEHFNTLD